MFLHQNKNSNNKYLYILFEVIIIEKIKHTVRKIKSIMCINKKISANIEIYVFVKYIIRLTIIRSCVQYMNMRTCLYCNKDSRLCPKKEFFHFNRSLSIIGATASRNTFKISLILMRL